MSDEISSPPEDAKVRTNSVVADYIKVLAWPILVLLVLVSFWSPLHEVAAMLPNLVSQSESISISGVSIKVSKSIGDRASSDVREVLNKLTSNDIRELLETSDGTVLFEKPDSPDAQAIELTVWKHFIAVGLANELSRQELAAKDDEDKKNYQSGFRTTDLYPKVRDLAVEFTVQAISQATVVKASTSTK
jgi:hypothetical protein